MIGIRHTTTVDASLQVDRMISRVQHTSRIPRDMEQIIVSGRGQGIDFLIHILYTKQALYCSPVGVPAAGRDW